MNYNFQSEVASEKLRNHSVCIKGVDGIRNINHYTELETEMLVMVCNMETIVDNKEILKGEMVRYFKLPI